MNDSLSHSGLPGAAELAFDVMRVEDLPTVMWMEERSFSAPWTEGTYRHEITANPFAFYSVLRPPDELRDTLPLLAYGGFWFIGDESHIVTIASHPNLRRRGIGEQMLLQLLIHSHEITAQAATLEVRPSNVAAIKLYEKWGFRQVGRRKKYYRDNGEDALLYTLSNLQSAEVTLPIVAAATLHINGLDPFNV